MDQCRMSILACVCRRSVIALLCGIVWVATATPLEGDMPIQQVYAAVGSPVEVPCGGEGGVGVRWTLNGSVIPSGSVLTLHNASLEDRGLYTCHSLGGGLIQRLLLHLGYPPSTPGVRCWSPSYPLKAICHWKLQPKTLLPTQYITTYSMGLYGKVQECVPVSGLEDHCAMEKLLLYSTEQYFINVTAVNPLGTATHILSLDLEDIIKPDPPVSLKVTPGPARRLIVTWAPPPSWPDPALFPLVYMVRYYWADKGPAHMVTLGPYEPTRMDLKGLGRGRTYSVQVSAEDMLQHGESSEWSPAVSATVSS